MMLKELNPGHIESNAGRFLIIMKEEIGISDSEVEEYVNMIKIEDEL